MSNVAVARWSVDFATVEDKELAQIKMWSQDRKIGAAITIERQAYESRWWRAFYLLQLRRGIEHARAQRGQQVLLDAVEGVAEPVPGS